MRIILVDDERPAIEELKYLLGQYPDATVVGEVSDSAEALGEIDLKRPDAVFLDINMPGRNGLELAVDVLRNHPMILLVFATAYDEFAVKAFELNAIDYLLKPFDEERFAKTMKRLHESFARRLGSPVSLVEKLERMIANRENPDHIEMMLGVGDQGVRKMIHADDILFVEAKQKKVMATTREGTWQIRETITHLEDKLDQASFIRVHKAFLVNIFKIAEIVPWFKGAYLIKFRETAHKVPVSRTYAPDLKARLNW